MNYWLMKTEPRVFSIYDLQKKGLEPWDGVRNYQARNYILRMRPGDLVLIYHSNIPDPGIAGLGRVASEPRHDFSALDPHSPYFDPRSRPDQPIWALVDIAYVEIFPSYISLDLLRHLPECRDLPLVKRGNRLSVMPVGEWQFQLLCALGRDIHHKTV